MKNQETKQFWIDLMTYLSIFLVEYILWLNGFFEWLKGL